MNTVEGLINTSGWNIKRRTTIAVLLLVLTVVWIGSVTAQEITADHSGVAYAPADPAGSEGHLLDIYLPSTSDGLAPVVLWSAGSGWLADNGRTRADWLVNTLTPRGYAVIGVSVRSSGQATFPAQLHDIKAAIRFVRANALQYGLDGNRIAVIGTSSGGWVASMAAVTQSIESLEGDVGVTGVPSTINAAVAFWPPSNFLAMDDWAIAPCEQLEFRGTKGFCHDDAGSPESRLIGCALRTCPEAVYAANPIGYVSPQSAPLLIIHGQSDPLVPHNQGESLYQAYNKACAEAVFVSVPKLGHGPLGKLMAESDLTEGATIRSTAAQDCRIEDPRPFRFTVDVLLEFLAAQL